MKHKRQLRLGYRNQVGRYGPTFAEFFAGIGLVRLGLEQAGWSVAFANDIDPVKLSIYEGHFGDASDHFLIGDIHAVSPDVVPTVALATASFPCTDLSIAGERRGLNCGESSAFWGFARLLKELGERRPGLVLLENVTGFLTSHGGDDFRRAMTALCELEYSVDAFMLDARWFVPQSRPRLFVVAQLNGSPELPCPLVPNRLRPEPVVRMIRSTEGSIRWRIVCLPDPPKQSSLVLRDILEPLQDDDPRWWSRERTEYLFNQMSPRHRKTAEQMIAKRTWSYGTVFRRVRKQPNGSKRSMGELRTDGIAGCLRTPKGGSGRQILWKAGYGRYFARLLTPLECARLMGADDFVVSGSLNDALFGFGDAVCVPAIRWIAENYLSRLVETEPESLQIVEAAS